MKLSTVDELRYDIRQVRSLKKLLIINHQKAGYGKEFQKKYKFRNTFISPFLCKLVYPMQINDANS